MKDYWAWMKMEITSEAAAEHENAISATTGLKLTKLGGSLVCTKARREERSSDDVPSWILDDVDREDGY